MKTLDDLKEQLQEDINSFLGDFIDEEELSQLCKIVVDRINELKENNKTI